VNGLGRRRAGAGAAIAAAGLVAATSATAQAPSTPTDYGGGGIPNAKQVAVGGRALIASLRVRSPQRGFLYVSGGVRCSRKPVNWAVRRAVAVAPATGAFELTANADEVASKSGRVRVRVSIRGTIGPSGIDATARVRANRGCLGGGVQQMILRPRAARTARRGPPLANTLIYGLSKQTFGGGGVVPPVILSLDTEGNTITALWTAVVRCPGQVGTTPTVSPQMHISQTGTFRQRVTRTIRLRGGSTRYVASFSGHFTDTGAQGSLRISAQYRAGPGAPVQHCDSRPVGWTASY
jgi:hypothetical protein